MLDLKRHGIDWRLVPDFEPHLDRVVAEGGQIIKQTPTKLVTMHQVAGATVYLKRYRNNGVRFRPLKYFFRESEAKKEWALAEQVIARGIPVVRHLAVGERWTATGLQESLIITAGFDGVRLDKYPHSKADDLQAALARLLRLMHDGGILQPDLHHNILVKSDPLELCRIDVDRGQIKPSLTDDERLNNLAYISIFVPLTDKFFAVYGASADFVRRVRRLAPALKRPLCARRSRWCVRRNLRFEPKRIGGLKWYVRKEFYNDKLHALLADPDGSLDRCRKLFKSGPNRTSTVGAFDGVVLKRYNVKQRISYLKDIVRPSRALQAYRKAWHLELLGLRTGRPVAAAERRVLRVLIHSYFVMEEIPGAIELGEYLRKTPKPEPAIIGRVADRIAQLHDHGFSHRDLKETNIVLDATGQAYVLDLEGLNYLKTVSANRAAADLDRLARAALKYPNLTSRLRFHFLLRYCRARNQRPHALFSEGPRRVDSK